MTLQQIPERRPGKIDFNLLPPEFRPAKASKLSLVLYVAVLVFACAIAGLIFMKSGVESENKSLATQLTGLQQELSQLQANKTEADAIKSQITTAENRLKNAETDHLTFIDDNREWSQVIDELNSLVPSRRITLSSISVSADNRITLQGISNKRMSVYDLAVDLDESPFFTGISFSFGDCPDAERCTFNMAASVKTISEMRDAAHE